MCAGLSSNVIPLYKRNMFRVVGCGHEVLAEGGIAVARGICMWDLSSYVTSQE